MSDMFMQMHRSAKRNRRTGLAAIRRSSTVREWPVTGYSFPGLNVSFGYDASALPVVTIAEGEIHIHAAAHATFAEASVTLLAETCTIYAQCRKSTLTDRQILVSATPPTTDDTFYRFKLYTFSYNTGTSTYARPPKIHRIGDIDFDTPVV